MFTPRWKIAVAFAAGSAGIAGAAEYLPRLRSVLPPCPVHTLTGLQCPGCGSTRMTLALLRGEISAAFGYNPLALLFVALVAGWSGWQGWHGLRHNRFVEMALPAATGRWVLWIVCAFTIARNLPWTPFRWLAPAG